MIFFWHLPPFLHNVIFFAVFFKSSLIASKIYWNYCDHVFCKFKINKPSRITFCDTCNKVLTNHEQMSASKWHEYNLSPRMSHLKEKLRPWVVKWVQPHTALLDLNLKPGSQKCAVNSGSELVLKDDHVTLSSNLFQIRLCLLGKLQISRKQND